MKSSPESIAKALALSTVRRVVYHGTPVAGFTQFRRVSGRTRGKSTPPSLGFHFGTAEAANARIARCSESEFALQCARLRNDAIAPGIYPVRLVLTNPLRMQDLGDWHNADRVARHLVRAGVVTQQEADAALATRGRHVALQRLIQSKGYDGIVYRNRWEDAGRDSFIVFDDAQIVSAFAAAA